MSFSIDKIRSKRKKQREHINEIGKNNYYFDYDLEKRIYCYVCCGYMKKRYEDKLDSEYKFNSYSEWRRYVYNKYEWYCKDGLMEFSRYLNQGIRNVKPSREYWSLVVPVLLSVCLAELFRSFLEIKTTFENSPILALIIAVVIGLGVWGGVLWFMIWQTIKPINDDNLDENMFIDYKEIIDEIICSKK